MTFNSSSELSKIAAEISSSRARTSANEARTQKAILGQDSADLGAQATEFILRAMLKAYQSALLIEAQEDLQARKALASA